ncbi:glutamate synthase subunit beta [Campylobacter sp. VicNov18]|uniref:glutamate synthase subunit beta n=1 Tax=Campylobacter bilis TaxID=2691918 RepID=UPI00130EB529|nr:glutamate synthase subunit beta [Campylobacter bilis]MPV64048.1 glutamate synthase small subunit [Campylobacter hepaticus]MBM0637550.1 glutamate synthase small subunit [Campylobacter bilis]MCC8278272.1 glutamate synthase subunit beta [Campylobacter bilis]MCC8299776.1 glutamate synthase subunit beta [Campylobacter bilis]MCC8301181.1 glutamate synthase subunit beta [Campylobacter bilis]
MGNPRGFLDFKRVDFKKLDPKERVLNFKEFIRFLDKKEQEIQGGRCMDCGVAFCHTGVLTQGKDVGCPLNNLIPEWNDLIYRSLWKEAYERLELTNPFPEFTGRVCPAPCEDSCVCAINGNSVSIKNNELAIIENAFKENLVNVNKPKKYNGKKIAIIGSGPSGLACANTLNSMGYKVSVFERSDKIGGLLMYGIPDMKLDKSIVNRRVDLLKKAGIEFKVNENIDSKDKVLKLLKEFNALVLCTGASKPIDLDIEGRKLKGIEFALDFLTQNTKSLLKTHQGANTAKGKNVLVIGSGDTSVDCIAVATRQGAKSIIRLERSPKRPLQRSQSNPWPLKADVFTTDYGIEEAFAVYGKDPRQYQKMTKKFLGKTHVEGVELNDLKREFQGTKAINVEVANSTKSYKADLVLLAMGFSGSEDNIAKNFGVTLDENNNISTKNFQTTHEKIFACGDARKGQSLVVWAIKDGIECALNLHQNLEKEL